jgi:hypothetical protein
MEQTTSKHAGSKNQRLNNQLKDEVYRQMLRLEAGRPGAEMSLAIALLHASVSTNSRSVSSDARQWLRKISPICLEMIEASLNASDHNLKGCRNGIQ